MTAHGATMTIICVLAATLVGCGATTPTTVHSSALPEAEEDNSAQERAEAAAKDMAAAKQRAQVFIVAKQAQDWGQLWDMAASVHKAIVISVGKRPAERDDGTARAQGFKDAAEVRAISDRDYFIRRRQALAKREQSVYKAGSKLKGIEVRPAILVPFPKGRISVHPIKVTMTDGTIDKLAATQEGGTWRMLEK